MPLKSLLKGIRDTVEKMLLEDGAVALDFVTVFGLLSLLSTTISLVHSPVLGKKDKGRWLYEIQELLEDMALQIALICRVSRRRVRVCKLRQCHGPVHGLH